MTIYTTIKSHSAFQKYALLLSLKDWESLILFVHLFS